MPFVLDASVTLAWALTDEDDPRADRAFASVRTDSAVVPALWWFEIRNSLLTAERRSRLSIADVTRFLGDLDRLPIAIDRDPDDSLVLSVARRRRLTVYDAAYLELALRRALPLTTLDRQLAAAAHAEGVELLTA